MYLLEELPIIALCSLGPQISDRGSVLVLEVTVGIHGCMNTLGSLYVYMKTITKWVHNCYLSPKEINFIVGYLVFLFVVI